MLRMGKREKDTNDFCFFVRKRLQQTSTVKIWRSSNLQNTFWTKTFLHEERKKNRLTFGFLLFLQPKYSSSGELPHGTHRCTFSIQNNAILASFGTWLPFQKRQIRHLLSHYFLWIRNDRVLRRFFFIFKKLSSMDLIDQPFLELSNLVGFPADQLKYLACILFCYPAGYVFKLLPNSPNLKYVYSILITIMISTVCLGILMMWFET